MNGTPTARCLIVGMGAISRQMYAFRAEADTGVRVKIDGKMVIEGWAQDGARTGHATLAKAAPVAIADRGSRG